MTDYPYFRFTDHATLDHEKRDNDRWLEHFKKLGIPACIVKSHLGEAVWRVGHEHIAQTNNTRSGNSEPLIGEILESVNGFNYIKLPEVAAV